MTAECRLFEEPRNKLMIFYFKYKLLPECPPPLMFHLTVAAVWN